MKHLFYFFLFVSCSSIPHNIEDNIDDERENQILEMQQLQEEAIQDQEEMQRDYDLYDQEDFMQ